MHIREIRLKGFKRFTDTRISGVSERAKLVVLLGPNGCGKSSLFDAFKFWHWHHGSGHNNTDNNYHRKVGSAQFDQQHMVQIDFHEPNPTTDAGKKMVFNIRSAYRNEADFTISRIDRTGPVLDEQRFSRLIDNDSSVSVNYRRLVSASVASVYSGAFDALNVQELRERFIGEARSSMSRVFDDLVLVGPGDPMQDGTFFFEKGTSRNFRYMNLSGGEKAAFDLLLDLLVKRREFTNTVYCIDEPETHMNTRLQRKLLEELYTLVPDGCQLWIATHSIGMMRMAQTIHSNHPDDVCFLSFHDQNFDTPVVMEPVTLDRALWKKNLSIALDDIAALVAPSKIVLCEGKANAGGRAAFDATCLRSIFSSNFPEVEFVPVGSQTDVESDRLEVGSAVQTLIAGAVVIPLVDRDDKSPAEVSELATAGIHVLGRRNLECYLFDDEILQKLCRQVNQVGAATAVLAAKQAAIQASILRGNPTDDMKRASGDAYVAIKRILNLTQGGNTADFFMRDTLAPLVTADTAVYGELRREIGL